ncbi:MAG: ankyrin repeat domain-containing protein [Pseudomonadota bacterium]
MAGAVKLKTVCKRLAKALEAEDHQEAAHLFARFAAADPAARRPLLGEKFRLPPATLLHFAAEGGNTEIARELLKVGAEIDARDGNHDTPLHLALRNEREKVALLLLNAGADCRGVNFRGWTVFHEIAAGDFSAKVIKAAVKAGASINALDQWGESTPLHVAARVARKRTIEQFIAAGADADVADGTGATPFLLASRADRPSVARVLLAAGSDVNAADERGRTALHFAARQRNHRMTQLLMENGANISLKDDLGQTPAQIILSFEEPQMMKALGPNGPKRRPSFAKRDEICFTILLMNYPGSAEYHETSFNGHLHETGQWSDGAFSILKGALSHLADRWAEHPLPREIAFPAMEVFEAVQFSVACHWHRNDGYKIEDISADELLAALDALRIVMAKLMGGAQRLEGPLATGDLKTL